MLKKEWLLFWLAAAILLFFANGSLWITDSVEANYALTAKEMVLSGDWISPQIYGRYWYDKPVLFYWLTALSFKIFGFTEFAARFFSAVFGMAALGMLTWGGKRLYGTRAGLFGGIVLLSSLEFFLISKSIITDAVLFFFFSGCLLFFYFGYAEGKAQDWYLMYICAALATLTKGPVGFLLPGLIIVLFLLWQKDWRVLLRMRLAVGIAVFLLLTLPWYGAMYYLHGADFIGTFFGTHNLLRAAVSEHPRDDVFYYYTLVNILALFPWSAVIPLAVYYRYKAGKLHFTTDERFFVLWAAVIFFFFQNMATKYITYTYPLLFPVALWLGKELSKNMELLHRKVNLYFTLTVYCALCAAACWYQLSGRGRVEQAYWIFGALVAGLYLFVYFTEHSFTPVYGAGAAAVIFYLALVHSVAVPLLQQRSAKELGMLLNRQAGSVEQIGLYGNYPTSAVFYSGKNLIKLLPREELASFAPRAYSWSSKNVMPFAAVEDVSYQIIAVNKKNVQAFERIGSAHKYTVFAESGEWLLFCL